MIVCIAGMHRSGASMVARLLNLCGLYLGESVDLPRPGPDYPNGLWQNVHFSRLNEEILSRVGAGWDSPPVPGVFRNSRYDLLPLRESAAKLVQSLHGREPWGWKDACNSITLPFWQSLTPDLKTVVCLRNPLEVARSLHDRRFSSEALGLSLWLEYNRRLLGDAAAEHRVITHYDAYFHDPEAELRRVLQFLNLPASDDLVHVACSAICRPARRHSATVQDLRQARVAGSVVKCYLDMCAEAGAVYGRVAEDGPGEADQAPIESANRIQTAHVRDTPDNGSHLSEDWLLRGVAGPPVARSPSERPSHRVPIDGLPRSLHRVRHFVAPERSVRRAVLRLCLRGVRIWRQEGLRALFRACRQGIIATAAGPMTATTPSASAEPPCVYDVFAFMPMHDEAEHGRLSQLASALARAGHRVFCVRALCERVTGPFTRAIRENLFELLLPSSPVHGQPHLSGCLRTENLLPALLAAGKNYGVVEAVSLVGWSGWGRLVLRLREIRGWPVIYDCAQVASATPAPEHGLLQQDDELTRRSDMHLAPSRALYERRLREGVDCVYLPNAADFSHYRFATHVIPQELVGLGRPIVGFHGSLSRDLDSELLRTLALARPGWAFVLVGPQCGADLSPLEGLPNVHILGERPYRVLPMYVHAFHVCMIPLRKTPLTGGMNPPQLFECLSAGKPVVATDLVEMQQYRPQVQLASGPEEWLAAIDGALGSDTKKSASARIGLAREHTWEERASQIRRHIPSLFPKVSIIIVSYDNLDYTRVCLESIYEKTVYPNVEVIVVDNASEDGSAAFLESLASTHQNLRVILNKTNEGFARANNSGLRAATGDYLVLLNNDTVVTRGWLSRLIRHLQPPEVGLVGPVTNWSPNESSIQVDYCTPAEMSAFAERYTAEHEGQAFDIPMLLFFCAAMRREVFEEIGFLDERFGAGLLEDRDYARRVKQAGYRVICAEDVFVHHYGKASFSKLGEDEFSRLFERNRRLYEEKWGVLWEGHQQRMRGATRNDGWKS